MTTLEIAFFAVCALFVVLGSLSTVAARSPIRSVMGLLAAIAGTAGMYLLLSAELLAAIQIIVYAGAVVVLFLFVIMLLGPASTSPRDARSAIPRYIGAGVFLLASASVLAALLRAGKGVTTPLPAVRGGFGGIERMGKELFTDLVLPFELSGVLLLVAVVGAVAVARGKQPDPTLGVAGKPQAQSKPESGRAAQPPHGSSAPHAAAHVGGTSAHRAAAKEAAS